MSAYIALGEEVRQVNALMDEIKALGLFREASAKIRAAAEQLTSMYDDLGARPTPAAIEYPIITWHRPRRVARLSRRSAPNRVGR